MHKCSTCNYWQPVTIHRHSWGECQWLKKNGIPKMPFWIKVPEFVGAIPPNQAGCFAHSKLEF